MSKQSERRLQEELAAVPTRPVVSRHKRRWPIAGILATLGFLFFLLLAHWIFGPEQSAWLQRPLGIVGALLALTAYLLFTRRREPTEELIQRLRLAQHSDFGKQLRSKPKPPWKVKLPAFGDVKVRSLGGFFVFMAVVLWWLTPWAPVRTRGRVLDDLTVPLSEELAMPVLILLDGRMAWLQPPVPPPETMEMAECIRDSDSAYLRGLKALAESRFPEARRLFNRAMAKDVVKPFLINRARAQTEMYAGRFEEALQWYRNMLLQKPDDSLLQLQAAVAAMHVGDLVQAEQLLGNRTRPGDEKPREKILHAFTLNAQVVLAALTWKDAKQAERISLRARRLFEDAVPTPHPFLAVSLNNQAVFFLFRARFPGAEELFEDARDIWVKEGGRQHAGLGTARQNLAVLHTLLSEYAEADEILDEVVDLRSAQPKDHLVHAFVQLARAFQDQHVARALEGRKAAEEALSITKRLYEDGHPCVGVIYNRLGAIQTQLALYAKSDETLMLAESEWNKTFGAHHPFVVDNLLHRGRLALLQNRLDEATTLGQQAEQISRQFWGDSHPDLADALCLLGQVELARAKPRLARAPLEEALKIRKEALGEEHLDVARTLGLLVSLESSSYTVKQREADLHRAQDIVKARAGADHPALARLLCGEAVLLAEQGKNTEALKRYEKALEIEKKMLPPYHPELAATLQAMAGLLQAAKNPPAKRIDALQAQAQAILKNHHREDQP